MVKQLVISTEYPDGIIIDVPDEQAPIIPQTEEQRRISELEAQLSALTEGYAEGVQNA